jgi:hypothetical protein
MADNQTTAFISYARADAAYAKRLYNDLLDSGVTPWIDTECIRPGENWRAAIRRGIKECRYFLALLSQHSVARRGFVQKELRIALELLDEFPDTAVFIIPLRLDDCHPTAERLHDLHWLDMFPSWDDGLRRLVDIINPADSNDRHIAHDLDSKVLCIGKKDGLLVVTPQGASVSSAFIGALRAEGISWAESQETLALQRHLSALPKFAYAKSRVYDHRRPA